MHRGEKKVCKLCFPVQEGRPTKKFWSHIVLKKDSVNKDRGVHGYEKFLNKSTLFNLFCWLKLIYLTFSSSTFSSNKSQN